MAEQRIPERIHKVLRRRAACLAWARFAAAWCPSLLVSSLFVVWFIHANKPFLSPSNIGAAVVACACGLCLGSLSRRLYARLAESRPAYWLDIHEQVVLVWGKPNDEQVRTVLDWIKENRPGFRFVVNPYERYGCVFAAEKAEE